MRRSGGLRHESQVILPGILACRADFPGPGHRKCLAMPGNDGVGLDNRQGGALLPPHVGEANPQQAIRIAQWGISSPSVEELQSDAEGQCSPVAKRRGFSEVTRTPRRLWTGSPRWTQAIYGMVQPPSSQPVRYLREAQAVIVSYEDGGSTFAPRLQYRNTKATISESPRCRSESEAIISRKKAPWLLLDMESMDITCSHRQGESPVDRTWFCASPTKRFPTI